MNVDAAKEVLAQEGWTPRLLPRRHGLLYLYAARKEKGSKRVIWRYIAPLSRLEDLTPEQIIAKLTRAKK